MRAAVAEPVVPEQGFRRRLLDGLTASITERGYRESTVADIVRHARTSKRTFYDHFASKEECFVELLSANNEDLLSAVLAAVRPEDPWREQVHQALTGYVRALEASPAITLSWIRELPALGAGARPVLRRGFNRLTAMIMELTSGPAFRAAGLRALSPTAAVILIGGLRELTAQTVEDGGPLAGMVEPAVAVATVLIADGRTLG